ncbi:class I SAM-dependent methyltransferase [Vibrio vulnificus]|uniref:class I SAM-dependent methyltransferase n=1 Tax=Vibrio vulnificus TaxID=672 RepID=UPI001A2287D5|nr:DUF4942 domain-containing protein [Vibrio vulnificus]HAS6035824.1 DUF4942 domain-containing protein [Vibrio vulnificus]HDY7429237.1 DUF4942 domain-containing protein [Vibrio vulnificus]HDY7489011.1 DUF4942 domain-containing protein [Vibrio vulnificus]HDY7951750.1 DUF4942 domain-containing protein [Vibrio vulnificus]
MTSIDTPVAKQSTTSLVKQLKKGNEDFEFYPSTQEQIQAIIDDVNLLLESHTFSKTSKEQLRIVDIGAGDGRVLNWLGEALANNPNETLFPQLFAIEKATLHTQSYREKGITLLGTDFYETNFISKQADIAFCNPPYEDFSRWLQLLIAQLNFSLLYVIVPERWENDPAIKAALETRKVTSTKVIAKSDFTDAERKARGKVHIVRFAFNDFEADIIKAAKINGIKNRLNEYGEYQPLIGLNVTCPFQQFIETELNLKKSYSTTTNEFSEYCEQERLRKELKSQDSTSFAIVKSRGVLWALLDNYERDMSNVLRQYKALAEIEPELLQELGVEYSSIQAGVKDKLFGYRSVYWTLLFDELDTLAERLTQKNKMELLNTLKANSLDFTYLNAVYIINYAVSLANELVESSITDVYKALTSEESISRYYKSNERMYNDQWRHNQTNQHASKRYVLDYRFVSSHDANFDRDGLSANARAFCNDLIVIFGLLGYSGIENSVTYDSLSAGQLLKIHGLEPCGKRIDLIHIRFFLNGNRHIKFDQGAMLRLNVTASRLLGWVRSKAEFEHEVDNLVSDAVWNLSDGLKILPQNILHLADKRGAL